MPISSLKLGFLMIVSMWCFLNMVFNLLKYIRYLLSFVIFLVI